MRALFLAPLLLLTACSDESDERLANTETIAAEAAAEAEAETGDIDLDLTDVNLSSELPGSLVDVVSTRDGQIELGVTDEVLFTRLSESLRREIEDEMEDETAEESGLGGTIARAVTGAVAEGLGMSVGIPLDTIEDVLYEDGEVVIVMADGSESPFAGTTSDGEPMLEQFSAESGARLADAFDKATGR